MLSHDVRTTNLAPIRVEGNDTDRFEMRLSGGEAELRFILDEETLKEVTDSGIPPPKPVRLKRVTP